MIGMRLQILTLLHLNIIQTVRIQLITVRIYEKKQIYTKAIRKLCYVKRKKPCLIYFFSLYMQKSLPLLRLTMMQQNQGGQVPTTIAQAAIRVSSSYQEKNNIIKKPTNKINRPPPVKSTYKVSTVSSAMQQLIYQTHFECAFARKCSLF